MNDFTLQSIAADLVPSNYLSVANNARVSRDKQVKVLLEKKKLPEHGWENGTIEYLIDGLALLDSNNFPSRCGVGEREARVVISSQTALRLCPRHWTVRKSYRGPTEGGRLDNHGKFNKLPGAGFAP
uniref:O-phosphoseryl-tRNA(Sec) selenium transferase n=1 Tax=Culex pipiens TaxID=7175 RepID=A0A8D8G204_CULPI